MWEPGGRRRLGCCGSEGIAGCGCHCVSHLTGWEREHVSALAHISPFTIENSNLPVAGEEDIHLKVGDLSSNQERKRDQGGLTRVSISMKNLSQTISEVHDMFSFVKTTLRNSLIAARSVLTMSRSISNFFCELLTESTADKQILFQRKTSRK